MTSPGTIIRLTDPSNHDNELCFTTTEAKHNNIIAGIYNNTDTSQKSTSRNPKLEHDVVFPENIKRVAPEKDRHGRWRPGPSVHLHAFPVPYPEPPYESHIYILGGEEE